MKSARETHNQAMDLAERAFVARMRGDDAEAIDLFAQALQAEMEAIAALEGTGSSEPTFSVLHRSAATLALDCNDPRLAERLTATALAHSPPSEIAEELRDLFEQINFRRHLLLRNVTLGVDEMQLSLAGRGVGFGVVESDEFLERVSVASKAIYRIVERRSGRAFREAGRVKKSLMEEYGVFVSVPRAASFAVTLKIGRPTEQLHLSGVLDTSQVIDEFMDFMELLNRSRMDELRERISDEAYYRNFVGLAKKMAPDGDRVRQVGLTSTRPTGERYVEVTRPKPEFTVPPSTSDTARLEHVTVTGSLRFADATHGERATIKIVEEGGESHDVRVPEGMMNDIVKPMWDSTVTVSGRREGRYILLDDISEA